MPRWGDEANRPEQARCDFCGRVFGPVQWNQRTCVRCAVAGFPDQSRMSGVAYQRALMKALMDDGKRNPKRSRFKPGRVPITSTKTRGNKKGAP